MGTPEPSYLTTLSPEYSSTAYESDFRTDFLKMIGNLKEKTNKSLKDCQENQEAKKEVKEITQDLNIKIETI